MYWHRGRLNGSVNDELDNNIPKWAKKSLYSQPIENRSEAISLSIINYLDLIPILRHTRIFPPPQFNQWLGDIPIPFYQGDESVLYGIPSRGKHLYSLCDLQRGWRLFPSIRILIEWPLVRRSKRSRFGRLIGCESHDEGLYESSAELFASSDSNWRRTLSRRWVIRSILCLTFVGSMFDHISGRQNLSWSLSLFLRR